MSTETPLTWKVVAAEFSSVGTQGDKTIAYHVLMDKPVIDMGHVRLIENAPAVARKWEAVRAIVVRMSTAKTSTVHDAAVRDLYDLVFRAEPRP